MVIDIMMVSHMEKDTKLFGVWIIKMGTMMMTVMMTTMTMAMIAPMPGHENIVCREASGVSSVQAFVDLLYCCVFIYFHCLYYCDL